jgi:hypothetical protein
MVVFSKLLPRIEQQWREAFVRFVETGQASEEFMNYLLSDATCQRMMEQALTERFKSVQPHVTAALASPVEKTRIEFARAFERAAALPEPERTEVLHGVASDLEKHMRARTRAAGR